MKKNLSTIDRVLRFVLVLVVAALYYFEYISGAVAIGLEVAALVILITSFIGWCPIYAALGISTKNNN